MNRTILHAGLAYAAAFVLLSALGAQALAQSDADTASDTAATAASDLVLFRGGDGHAGYLNTTLPGSLAVLWQNTTAPGGQDPSAPALYNGVLYFGSGNHVYAVNASDGTVKWQYPDANYDQSGQTPLGPFDCPATVSDGKVYIGADDNRLYVLDADTGENLWQFEAGGAIESAPVILNGVIYFGSDDNNLYDLRLDNRQEAWGGPFKTTGSITASPMIENGFIYFADDTNIYGASLDSGRLLWQQRVIGGMTAPPVLDNGLIYVGVARTLEAIVARSGSNRWQATLPSEPSAAATTGGPTGLVYVPTSDGHVCALDSRGSIRWTTDIHDSVNAPPLLTPSALYVATASGALYNLDPATGDIVWVYSLHPATTGNAAVTAVNGQAMPVQFSPQQNGPGPYGQQRNGQQQNTVPQVGFAAAPVATSHALYVLATDGTLTAFSPNAADTVPPTVVSTFPSSDAPISGVNIPYQITLDDIGSGVNPASVTLKVDNKPIPVSYDPVQDLVQVKAQTGNTSIVGRAQVQLATLDSGQHTAILTASDWRGNKLTYTWGFTVDSSLNPPESNFTNPGTVLPGNQDGSDQNNPGVNDDNSGLPDNGGMGAPGGDGGVGPGNGGAEGGNNNGGGNGGGGTLPGPPSRGGGGNGGGGSPQPPPGGGLPPPPPI